MSDQQPPAQQDTAAVAGPEEAPGTAQEQSDVDWQKRYTDLQPEYTRTTQRNSELERQQQWYEIAMTAQDEDTRRQALEQLGYEIPDDVEDPEPTEYEDPYERLQAEVSDLRQWRDQTTQGDREAEQGQLIRELTDERLAALEGLDKQDEDLVLAYAINALPPVREPGVPVPLPDVRAAYEYFQQRETERQKAWANGKRRAPHVLSGGQEATQAPLPLDATSEQRVAHALQKMQERDAMQ